MSRRRKHLLKAMYFFFKDHRRARRMVRRAKREYILPFRERELRRRGRQFWRVIGPPTS